MFSLRFCAHWIETRLNISPIGLLFICSVLAVIGLRMIAGIDTFAGAMVALVSRAPRAGAALLA